MNAAGFGLADFELYHVADCSDPAVRARPAVPPGQPCAGPRWAVAGRDRGRVRRNARRGRPGRAVAADAAGRVRVPHRAAPPPAPPATRTRRLGLLKSHHRLDAGSDGPDFNLTSGTGSPLVHVSVWSTQRATCPPAARPMCSGLCARRCGGPAPSTLGSSPTSPVVGRRLPVGGRWAAIPSPGRYRCSGSPRGRIRPSGTSAGSTGTCCASPIPTMVGMRARRPNGSPSSAKPAGIPG